MKLLSCECCGGNSLQKHGENAMICSFCGSVYLLDDNEKIVSSEVTDAKILALLIEAKKYYREQKYADEIQTLVKAIELNENKVMLWVKLGRAYRNCNLDEKALECYEKAKQIDASYGQIYANTGAVYLLRKDYIKAMEYYEKALSLMSETEVDYPVVLANYGIAAGGNGDRKKAASLINEAERKGYPNSARAREMAGLSIFSKWFG